MCFVYRRDEKTAADERAAESSLREETLRERLATASDETETLRQRLFGVTGEGNEGGSGRVLEEFQKPTESVTGSKQIPESISKSDPPASPVRNQSETKPVPDTPPASPSTFASFFGFGESPSKPPNEETNKPAAAEIPKAAFSSGDYSESGRDAGTMRPLTDPAPVAITNVEDAGGTGRRLYDADEADGAMATLRTELDHRSTQIGQLQDGVRRLMEQMSRVQSEKDSVESVAEDLTEKNASLQSKVIARVVHLMRNASTAKSFRTWRDITQSEKISRAGAEKTAALMRASTDEFKVAKLTDEVEELRTRLAEATTRAETAETKAATAEKWAEEAEVRVSFYFRFRTGD